MRPPAPHLTTAHPQSVGPTSPPQTPTTASSPTFASEITSPKIRGLPLHSARPMASDSHIRPVGNGHNFSYTRPVRPEQLSPQSSGSLSGSLSAAPDSDSDLNSYRTGSPLASIPQSIVSEQMADPAPPATPPRTSAGGGSVATQAAFILEEMSDYDDSGDEELEVIRPVEIEYAESNRSRSRSRHRPEIDPGVMSDLRNLNCSEDSDLDMPEAEYQAMLLRRREEKRRKRMTSGSIGKRTISESIGSDTDREDLKAAFLDANEVGSSARRLRRKVGDRHSLQLQFHDPPTPRIDELEEPDSTDEDGFIDGETLARELPYYNWEYVSVMEVD